MSALGAQARLAVREVCALAPSLGLLPPPSRPAGIAAIVRVRDEEEWLEPAVRSIMRQASRDNYRISSLILAIVQSTPFQMRRTPGP